MSGVGPVLTYSRLSRVIVALLICCVAGRAQDSTDFFEKCTRPVLAAKYYGCHATNKPGGLQVDSCEALVAGDKSGPTIVPGNPEGSLLIHAIRQVDPKLKMPMNGEKLNEEQIADFSSWVQAGAPWPASGATRPGFHIAPEQRGILVVPTAAEAGLASSIMRN
jgi:hypothetical protein